jgi:hypothetical protein
MIIDPVEASLALLKSPGVGATKCRLGQTAEQDLDRAIRILEQLKETLKLEGISLAIEEKIDV